MALGPFQPSPCGNRVAVLRNSGKEGKPKKLLLYSGRFEVSNCSVKRVESSQQFSGEGLANQVGIVFRGAIPESRVDPAIETPPQVPKTMYFVVSSLRPRRKNR